VCAARREHRAKKILVSKNAKDDTKKKKNSCGRKGRAILGRKKKVAPDATLAKKTIEKKGKKNISNGIGQRTSSLEGRWGGDRPTSHSSAKAPGGNSSTWCARGPILTSVLPRNETPAKRGTMGVWMHAKRPGGAGGGGKRNKLGGLKKNGGTLKKKHLQGNQKVGDRLNWH